MSLKNRGCSRQVPTRGGLGILNALARCPPTTSDQQILAEWDASGLAGRGGGAFPTARKIAAVQRSAARTRRAPVVIGNGSEGEPLSCKDQLLLVHAPHLVLDGPLLTARILGASHSWLAAKSGVHPRLLEALAERGENAVALHATDSHFLAGQATAVMSSLEGGPSLPRHPAGHLSDAGLAGAPTLLVNVETLAHLALIARYSAAWFQTAGTAADPGSRLLTIHDQGRYQVHEVHGSSDLSLVLEQLQISAANIQAVLVGGYHGQWTKDPRIQLAATNDVHRRPVALAAGAGVIEVLRHDACPLERTSQIIDYLARSSARQCGPCLHGSADLGPRFSSARAAPRQCATDRTDSPARCTRDRPGLVPSSRCLGALGHQRIAGFWRRGRGAPLWHLPSHHPGAAMSAELNINWTRCQGRGLCLELMADSLDSDPWGYPAAAGRPGHRSWQGPGAGRPVGGCSRGGENVPAVGTVLARGRQRLGRPTLITPYWWT
ncbi:hypothetical protein AAHB37_15840 [Glutamicibacter halophytocola]|uniref:hypothetical protein n=1 Tax=Glutamicibacter halophytocola TaxID=1933880 RepID=UPI00321B04A3